jgi:hypothetical protein
MQQVDIAKRDCFKYFVTFDDKLPQNLQFSFSTKKNSVGFGLYFKKASYQGDTFFNDDELSKILNGPDLLEINPPPKASIQSSGSRLSISGKINDIPMKPRSRARKRIIKRSS